MSQTIQIRRGSDSSRTTITLNQGEPAWTTDTKKLYIGDGSTAGGCLINNITGNAQLNTSDLITGNESRFVHTTGNETINGDKIFQGSFTLYDNTTATNILEFVPNSSFKIYETFNAGISIDVYNRFLGDNAGNTSLNWVNKILSGNWQVATASIPASSTSAGTKGMITISGSNLLIATGTNMWAKIALTSY